MRRLIRLLIALLGFALLTANAASAHVPAPVEKPASGSLGAPTERLGGRTLASSERVREKPPWAYDGASDSLVAAEAIPWTTRAVRAAAKDLEGGATDVTVASRSEAEELFLGRYQGAGYRNTTGMSPTETKDFFGSKAGTYHWDIGDAAYPHDMSHLQIHTVQGPVVRIFFPD